MPAKAGVHLRLRWESRANLDSGPGSSPGQALRRNDEMKGLVPATNSEPLGLNILNDLNALYSHS